MPWWQFWREPTEAEKLEERMRKEAEVALAAGDIPPLAKERIRQEMARGSGFFSSDLSVREFLLTREAGIVPIAQVMGTAFFNVSFLGSYMGSYRATGELAKITAAQMEARRLALARLKIEAKLFGASGVIGVRIQSRPSSYMSSLNEFIAYGTAVRIPDYPAHQEPFTSDLNGQEFWRLYRAGYQPRAVVMGLCSYYLNTNWRAYMQQFGLFGMGSFSNQEIEQYTYGFNEARTRAIDRLTQQAYELQADGAVGMTVSHEIERIEYGDRSQQTDLLINFMAMGTAVDAGPRREDTPASLCIDLRKGKAEAVTVAFGD